MLTLIVIMCFSASIEKYVRTSIAGKRNTFVTQPSTCNTSRPIKRSTVSTRLNIHRNGILNTKSFHLKLKPDAGTWRDVCKGKQRMKECVLALNAPRRHSLPILSSLLLFFCVAWFTLAERHLLVASSFLVLII